MVEVLTKSSPSRGKDEAGRAERAALRKHLLASPTIADRAVDTGSSGPAPHRGETRRESSREAPQ